jgi:hypothetical protein
MKAYWKIPKEWVQEWGLSPAEALVLSDIQAWPNCGHEERAKRVGLSPRQLTRIKDKMSSDVRTKCLIGLGQNVLKKRTKCPKKSDKMSFPPYNPLYIEEREEQEDITLDKSNVPNADAAAGKKTSQKKKKKYTDEEIKLHGELKAIFCEEWLKTHGEEFYWGPAAMSATIKIADQIKFYMPPEQKNDTEQLKFNFHFFVQKILTSQDNWLRTNATPQVIASKFNEIYTSLKNGKPRQQQQQNGPTDDFLRRVAAEVEANGGLAF